MASGLEQALPDTGSRAVRQSWATRIISLGTASEKFVYDFLILRRKGPGLLCDSVPHHAELRLRLFFLLKLEDARVCLIGHFGKHQQVVATEALRPLPLCRVPGHAEWAG